MRKLIPYLILGALTVLAGGAALLSWHQSDEPVGLSMYDCNSQGLVAPSNFVLTCADANTLLKNLHWTDWNKSTAYATGIASWNDCTPDCVSGTWHSAPITVYAYRVRDGHYTRMNSHHSSVFSEGPFDASIYPPTN
jgi:hypothetical protein